MTMYPSGLMMTPDPPPRCCCGCWGCSKLFCGMPKNLEERIESAASSAETAVTARFDLFGYFDVHDAFDGVLGRI
ncbi:MAG: hypothetical protein ACLR8Y_11915 [Alistipes indistinctus]